MSEITMTIDEIKTAVAKIKEENQSIEFDLDNFDEVAEDENNDLRLAEFNAKWWNLLYWWAIDTKRQPNEKELDALKDCVEIECDADSKIAYVRAATV